MIFVYLCIYLFVTYYSFLFFSILIVRDVNISSPKSKKPGCLKISKFNRDFALPKLSICISKT